VGTVYSFVSGKAGPVPDVPGGRLRPKRSAMSPEEYPVKRRTPRYPFAAPAAVLPETGAPVGGNIKELSLYGCYLDSASTLPPRARVLLKIFVPGEYFEAQATVAYATPALGMGLVFRDVQPHFRSVLRKWLLLAMQLSQPSTLQGVEPTELKDEQVEARGDPTDRCEKGGTDKG
jgi:hypothetical protein